METRLRDNVPGTAMTNFRMNTGDWDENKFWSAIWSVRGTMRHVDHMIVSVRAATVTDARPILLPNAIPVNSTNGKRDQTNEIQRQIHFI